MINLTTDELEHYGSIIANKVMKDKRFEKFNDEEIATLFAYGIILIGRNMENEIIPEFEEAEHSNENGDLAA